MLPQDRHREIMKQLYEFQTVKISSLSKMLNVTRETVRKDLYDMEEKGLVRKVHGGAVLNKANLEINYADRKSANEAEKRSIAKRASDFVENGDTLYVDYGTTALLFIREILNKRNLTIVTNSLPIANEIIDFSDFEVIIIGGQVRKNEKSLFGPLAYRGIEKIYVDKGFFGVSGVDIQAGFTNIHMGESEVSRLMIQHSKKNIVMADSSKFNIVSMNQIASIEQVDVLVTDEKANKALLKQIIEKNVEVIIETIQHDD
ncbi:DeoR/GlpR family DNA-binding transcription regulator [Lysinibacillus sp. FSL H8-0500]|uniref:DeoR/GlpR family DNA-binding transcription regulator n=1 Tax=Lysinibacillus sp. FSL H8-0500 TaxID=2921393 RepID=UPI00310179B8